MKIGLTGGIGSGKTTISKMFEKLGCKLYNSDERAKVLYFIPEIRSKIIELLSDRVYISETEINKDFIFDIVFNNQSKLDDLNNIFIVMQNRIKYPFTYCFIDTGNPASPRSFRTISCSGSGLLIPTKYFLQYVLQSL